MSAVSDSDDEKPILELIQKRKRQAAAEAAVNGKSDLASSAKKVKVEGSTVTVKKEKSSTTSEEKSASKSSGTGKSGSSSSSTSFSSDFYETDKGIMVQRLLCRWWYAITWPRPEDISAAPPGYENLDGFPGVFICTTSENLGKIIDTRNAATCPSLRNLAQWPAARIQETCIKAYTAQMEALAQAEGDDSTLYRSLKKEMREVSKMDPAKADRDARKFDFSAR